MGKNLFEKKSRYKLIDGMITGAEPLGYCHYQGHRGYISKGILNVKECNKKNCRYFQKNTDHEWWLRKERIKAIKAAIKAGKVTYNFDGKTYLVSKKI